MHDWLLTSLAHPTALPSGGVISLARHTQSFASAAIATTNVAHMQVGKGTPKSGAPALCIERFGDLRIAAISCEFVNACDRLLGCFQRSFSRLGTLDLQPRHSSRAPADLDFDPAGSAHPIQLHRLHRQAQQLLAL